MFKVRDEASQVVGHLSMHNGVITSPPGASGSNMCSTFVRGRVKVADLLGFVTKVIRRKSRHGQVRVRLALQTLHSTTAIIANSVAHHFASGRYAAEQAIHVPELFREGSNRPRRLNGSFKVAVSQAS